MRFHFLQQQDKELEMTKMNKNYNCLFSSSDWYGHKWLHNFEQLEFELFE
ncbi:hypothetical protein T06_13440 [Trichinella sp. T6]|nr:hypothetical protein T06_13440 [Trichinella sp. T6]